MNRMRCSLLSLAHRAALLYRRGFGACGSALRLACAFALATLVGCARPRTVSPEVDPAELSDMGFQSYLGETGFVTVGEAYRAMLILADGEDGSGGFEERRQKLETRGIARSAWRLQEENRIDTGAVAYMVCQVCRIDGGVNMRLFGRLGLSDRRYALRELVYRGMIEDAVDYQPITGQGLLSVMAKADELMQQKGLYEAEDIGLTDEADRDAEGNLIVPDIGG